MWVELVAGALSSVGLFVYGALRRRSADEASVHPVRRALLQTVRRLPGKRLRDLWRPSGLTRGSVEYHMRILERAALVKAVRGAGEVRFFPVEGGPKEPGLWSAVLYGRNLELSELVAAHPDWCQKDFANRLGIPRKEFRRYMHRLEAAQLVRVKRDKYRMRYEPTQRMQEILPLVRERVAQEGKDCGRGDRP